MKIAGAVWQSLLFAAAFAPSIHADDRELSTSEVFVACGDPARTGSNSNCKKNGEFFQYTSAALDELHAVRCCIDNGPLGLRDERDMCGGPTSISYIDNVCHIEKTFAEAEALCSSQGARLCTVYEINNDCTRSSGCNFDQEHIWTTTPFEDPLPRDPSIPVSDGTHYVTCGDPDRSTATDCKTNGQFVMSRPAQDMEEHEVRCCADSPLGWPTSKEMCEGVWGGSEVPVAGQSKCLTAKNYLQAKGACEDAGARLCTVWEVQNHCTQSTGCGFDNHYVWTATEALDDGPVPRDPSVPFSDGEHMLACGDPYRNAAGCKRNGVLESPTEGHDMEEHVVRCCSDDPLGWSSSKMNTGCDVYGGTYIPVDGQEKCVSAKNYLEAEAVCSAAGARLCTVNEAMMGCTQGTGCGYDNYYFWTSTDAADGYSPPTASPTIPIEQFDTDHWLVCGDPDRDSAAGCKDENGDFHATYQGNGMEKHEVRCCSDGKLDWMGDGNAKNRPQYCGDVWGASYINGVCYSDATYGEAKRICEDNDARLCTQLELANGCAEATGCHHDTDWVWSSTEVVDGTQIMPSNASHYAACGSPAATTSPLCMKEGHFMSSMSVEDGTDLEVRCCSEHELPWFVNSRARKQSGCSVYGISEIPLIAGSSLNTMCMKAKTHWEAESICSQNGARLCTVEEIVKGCSRGSGCGFDRHMVWTGTPACTGDACEAEKHTDKHLGCFADTRGDQRLVFNLGSPFSINTCFESCEKAGYGFFALKEGGSCYCGDALDIPKNITSDAAERCNRPCAIGGYGGCGGTDAVDLYATGITPNGVDNYESKYVGCFKDDIKAMTMINADSSITSCVDECSAHPEGFALAGMMNGKECFCGKSLLEGKSNDCTMGCDNGKGLCGGSKGMSIYKTTNTIRPLQKLLECRGSKSSWWGDPHLTTFDGLKYNCQGIGHFILTECIDYQLQAMFKAATGSGGKASVTDGIAATYRTFPKVQVSIADWENEFTEEVAGCPVNVFVANNPVNISAAIIHPDIDIRRSGNSFEIQFPFGGPALRVKVRKGRGCLVDVDTCIPETCLDTAVGLLGTPNGDITDEWMHRNGQTIWPRPNNYKGKGGFDYCTEEWCVQNLGDSLFTYGPDKSFEDYDECASEYAGELPTDQLPDDVKEECKKTLDEEACLTDAVIGGRDAVEEIMDNDLDLGDDDDDDEEEYFDDPSPPNCPEDVELIGQIGPDFENWPVKVLEYGTTDVKLEIKSPLRVSQTGKYFYVQYPEKSGAQDQCVGFTEVDKKFTTEVSVQCMHSSPYALVHVFSADTDSYDTFEGEGATIFPCCHAPDEALAEFTAQYTFAVSCVKRCPEEKYAVTEA